ncbi:MAG TPA: hypothetical protein VL225_17575 [Vicinamibacterales bacterium]|jgi:hypothetical protein|nr:hypothetical protein [Vicinamibacterales bacterium]
MKVGIVDDRGLLEATMGDGRPLLALAGVLLVGCGGFAVFQAATGNFLPHDSIYLGMTARELCALQDCRILHFMIHDRISFGGVLIAIGVLYLWLALFPMRNRESWAWWALAFSSLVGFLSFLSYLGYGYLDTWHGAATLTLVPLFFVGLIRSRRLRRKSVAPNPVDLHSASGFGRALLLLSSIGIGLAGLTIMTVGMTSVFVPQDLEFMGLTRVAIGAINPHLVPLIAHDRAGFGGALLSFGVAMFGCLRYGRPSRAFWQALTVSGIAGFGTAVGVHPAIGYLSAAHLGPALLGCFVFGAGLALAALDSGAQASLSSSITAPAPAAVRRCRVRAARTRSHSPGSPSRA